MGQAKQESWLGRLECWLWQSESNFTRNSVTIAWHMSRVLYAVVRDIVNGHITLHAMGLVYTTLLSMVPFLALSFSVLKGFGAHDQLEPMLLTAMEPLGEQRFEIVNNLITFVDNIKVGVLGSVGLGMLIYTVISLVQKVERSFNEIWRVNNVRSLAQRFSNYLSVIMTGPLLMFSALGATAALIGSETAKQLFAVEPFGHLLAIVTKLMPYLMIIGLFTFLYTFIPNTKVKLKNAFLGGLVAGIIWQTTGVAFTKFVAGSTQYAAIYSGFAVGIILLIWMYLAWLILLIGASVSFYAQHAHQITRSRRQMPSAEVDELTGLAIMHKVASLYDEHGGSSSISEMESSLSVGPEAIQRVISRLLKSGLVVITGDEMDELVPGKPLDKVSLYDLLRVLRQAEDPIPSSIKQSSSLNQVADELESQLRNAFDQRTLADWIRTVSPKCANISQDDQPG